MLTVWRCSQSHGPVEPAELKHCAIIWPPCALALQSGQTVVSYTRPGHARGTMHEGAMKMHYPRF